MNTSLSPRTVDTELAQIGRLLSRRDDLKAELARTKRKLQSACARHGLTEALIQHMAAHFKTQP